MSVVKTGCERRFQYELLARLKAAQHHFVHARRLWVSRCPAVARHVTANIGVKTHDQPPPADGP
jgi:hypothetical protein